MRVGWEAAAVVPHPELLFSLQRRSGHCQWLTGRVLLHASHVTGLPCLCGAARR